MLHHRSLYFTIREPDTPPSPVVVEIPHAGLLVDPESLATLVAPAFALGRDADLYVDELFADAPSEGATLLVSHMSRYVCDLNRGEQDVDSGTVEGGTARSAPHGIIWRSTTDDRQALIGPLPASELERRLELIYRPYHRALAKLLEQRRHKFGYAILLCGHSMPSRGRAGHADPGRERADVVPGSRGRTSARDCVVDAPEHVAREMGLTVAHDRPYRGGYSTGHYGRPSEGVHAVQVELSRRLYMDERSLAKEPSGFAQTRRYCRALVAKLVGLRLPG